MSTYTDLLSELRAQSDGVSSQLTLIRDVTARVVAVATARVSAGSEGLEDALSDTTNALESIGEALSDLLGELIDCTDELEAD